MKTKELSYFENIVCPYCSSVLIDKEADVAGFETCEHTIFVATDYGFEFIHEKFKNVISKNVGEKSYDEYTEALSIDGIRLVQYNPPPSYFGAYWGFVEK